MRLGDLCGQTAYTWGYMAICSSQHDTDSVGVFKVKNKNIRASYERAVIGKLSRIRFMYAARS